MGPREFTRGDSVVAVDEDAIADELQWGRGSSPAETRPRRIHSSPHQRASMGPREFTRGDSARWRGQLTRSPSFNGAAGVHPRRRCRTWWTCSEVPRLQWGRGSSPAETRGGRGRHPPIGDASMGPREFTRGDDGQPAGLRQRRRASMGPREFTRGDPVTFAVWAYVIALQWGRGSSPAETSRSGARRRPAPQLQWGRGSSPAET